MNKLIKSKVLIGKIGILIVILSICLGLFQRQMVNAHATTSNELPFDVSFKDKFTVLDPAGKKGRTWKATVTGDGLYYGTLGVWAETSDLSTQEKNKQFAELNKFPGIEAVESKYSILGGKEKIVFGVFIRNKTSAEIQDYLNNCLYINSPNVENGVQDFKITGKVLNKYVNITYKADTESNNGNGTVTVNSKKLEKNGSMDVKLNKNLDKYIDTPVTITMTPEPGSYVDGISINGVTQRYNGPEEKTYTIPNITEHTTITPSFSLAGTDITHGVDGNNRNQGNLAWVDTRTNLTYKEALEFNYNAKVTDFILNSNFGKSWTYGQNMLENPKMFMSAQFENSQLINVGKSPDNPVDMGKIGGESPTKGMALNTGIKANQVIPGKFTQTVTADYYTASSICQNHWYHVFGVAYHMDGMTRKIVIAKDTLSLTLGNQFNYGDQIIPELIPASKDIAGSQAIIDGNKVQYKYVGIDGTTYNSSIAPTMPGKYKVIVTYDGDTYIQAYDDSNPLTKEFTINKSTPNDKDVKTPTVKPHAESLELSNLVEGQLYSIDGNKWYTKEQIETNNPFTKLDQNKAYSVQTKIAETETSNESVIKQVTATTLVKLSGKVTGRDLPASLTFTSDGNNYNVITDENGNYSLEVPAGKYAMTAEGKIGDETYKSKNPIDVNKADTVVPTINMERTQQGQDKDHANEFVATHLTDKKNNMVKEVNSSTVDMILGGETEFNKLSSEAKKYVNNQLTDANPNTYQEMLNEAKKYVKESADKFVKDNLTDKDGKVIISVSKDTMDQILAAEDKYNDLSQSEKDEINAQLSKAAGKPVTYEKMLEEAKTMLDETTDKFIKDHMTNTDGIIIEVNESTLDNILGGEEDFNALTDTQKAEVNAKLKDAGATQTYEEMLEAAHKIAKDNASQFVKDNLTDKDGKVITSVTKDSLDQILAAEDKYNALSQSEKDEINAQLSKAAGKPVTYEKMLEEAKTMLDETTDKFIKDHMTNTDGIITEVNESTLDNILGGEEDFSALTDAQKAEVNAKLKAAGATLTYEEMLALAKTKVNQSANEFIKKYASDNNGYIYKLATKDNYAQILSGKDTWDKLSQSEKDAINAILKANNGKTYEELLKQANAIKDSVKTDDETNMMPLYILLLLSLFGGYILIKKREEA